MLTFYFYLLRTSIKASMSKRGAFLIESGLMIGNNLIFLSIWWIFFHQFHDVGGWQLNDMVALLAIGTGSYGLMLICFGGVKDLAKMICNGDLDPFMTQPKNLLLHILGSKSLTRGWGHLLTALILILLEDLTHPFILTLMILSLITGCLVFTSMNIIAYSLPFWLGPVETVSQKYCDALFLFALYPTNIYSGWLHFVMFTFIPAGVIGYLPVELIRFFSWPSFLFLLASSLTFVAAAFFLFFM